MAGRGSSKGTVFTRRLRINSEDRVFGPEWTTSNFVIDMGNNIKQVRKISVESAQFNNVFYNVFETKTKFNNYFKLIVNNGASALFGTHILRIPPGYYSAYTLGTAIATALTDIDSLGETIEAKFTLNETTNMMSVTMQDDALDLGNPGGSITSVTTEDQKSGAFWPDGVAAQGKIDYWPFGLLGFGDFDLKNLPGPSPATPKTFNAIYMPSLNNPSICYITSRELAPSNSIDEKGNTSNILLPINITAPFRGLVVYECKQDILDENDFGRPRDLSRVDIQLVDHDLDPLDLNQTDMNLELRIWYNG